MTGLNDKEVIELQKKYGKNVLEKEKRERFLIKIIHIICEPMFLLLIIASLIYFLLGEARDGVIMLIFVIVIITIDIIQEWKTDKTLNALKDLSEPKITVLRNSKKIEILSSELVPGDIMYIHEGIKIPADGYVIKCSGLRVDESSLTGESVGVWKNTIGSNNDYWKDNYCYQGTLVTQGTGIIKVDKTGNNTEYGKIGTNLNKIVQDKSPLQKQTDKLVKLCAIIALILFVLVALFTFINLNDYPLKKRLIESVLSGITLAMAMIPEEFPVVLTVFLSMGAWRLAKNNSLIKKLPAVETLGAVSVLCVDKTGTITENKMEVISVITLDKEKEFAKLLHLCCEDETYDPMEISLINYANKYIEKDKINKTLIKDYPFDNNTKIMGKGWKIDNKLVLIAKGSPENIIKISKITKEKLTKINNDIKLMQEDGLRVIALAKGIYESNLPNDLTKCNLEFVGIVGLIDPPREKITENILKCHKAGVRVVMITGDSGVTASSIAKKIGIDYTNNFITGYELDNMTDDELREKVKTTSIFSRVIPEHKSRIVKAFQVSGEVVAMTGDGVNDAVALKQAEIGIALGKKGSEVSKEAADLILLDDNFNTIANTIEDGRRIYDNIKKAISYILVIHIPIALSSLLAPILKISPSNILLLPIHIVLLELIIDPTCSIVLERQPKERNIMNRKPRDINENIVTKDTLIKSIIQGIIIFISSFGIYYYLLNKDILLARTMGILIIMISNIFLVQVNSSDYDYAFVSIKKIVKDKVMLIVNLLMILGMVIIIYSPLHNILKLKSLSVLELLIVIFIAFASVFWYEIVKLIKNN